MGLTFGYGPAANRSDAVKLIRGAYEKGVTFFDSAEAYGEENEVMLGEAVASFRKHVVHPNVPRVVDQLLPLLSHPITNIYTTRLSNNKGE
jgi:predicted aldo/keto reductase-like oxidoreductase